MDVLISYRRNDDPHAVDRLCAALREALAPGQIFLDIDSIPVGTDFVEHLQDQVSRCRILLAVIGPRWLDARTGDGMRRLDDPNDFVRIEIQTALDRKIPVVPVLLDDTSMPGSDDLPEPLKPLATRQAWEIKRKRFSTDVGGLAFRLKEILASSPSGLPGSQTPSKILNSASAESHHRALSGRREVPRREKPSIAVLPFRNMSGDPEQEYFSDGISEDIITDLSKLSELHVTARNSSFVYKKTEFGMADVAKALGVRYLIEGSVRKSGDRVRVNAQLIDTTTGGHVWANRYDRALTDIFAVQDELTREIVTELKLKLPVGEERRLAKGRAVDIKAYEFLLRAREAMLKGTKSTNIAARGFAGEAIAIEPGYAGAHATIAFSHLNDYVNSFSSDPQESLRAGLELAKRVLEMDAEEPAGYFVLGIACLWTWQLDEAEAQARKGLALSPNSADLLILMGSIQIYSGDPAGALVTFDAVMRLDPHYPEIWLQYVAEAHFSLGEYAQAIAAIEQRLTRNPRSETANALLASCYGCIGRPEDGRRAWEQVLKINPRFSMERRRRVLPFRNPADFEHRVEGLRKAGLTV